MKKTLLMALAAIVALPGIAQTDFRHISYQEAVAAAKAENKMLFLDFYTDWCGPCKMMINKVFPQKEVGDYFNAKFVCLKVNAEKEGKELAVKHAIKAYPTFVVLDANEKVLGTKEGGNLNGMDFISEIDRLTDPDKTPERLKQRYESGERTAELVSAYAGLLKQEAMDGRVPDEAKMKEVSDIITAYFNGLDEAAKLNTENLFLYTSFAGSVTEPTGQFMIANRDKFDASVKENIAKTIKSLFNDEVYSLFVGRKPYDEAAYQELNKKLKELGFYDEYALMCRFIECHAKGDLNVYIDFCEEEYGNLDETAASTLAVSYADLFKNADEATKKRAAKFLRNRLPEMDCATIYFTATQIAALEGAGH